VSDERKSFSPGYHLGKKVHNLPAALALRHYGATVHFHSHPRLTLFSVPCYGACGMMGKRENKKVEQVGVMRRNFFWEITRSHSKQVDDVIIALKKYDRL
jgi:hypothetical protein